MPIERVHSFLEHPAKHVAAQPAISGTTIPRHGSLYTMFVNQNTVCKPTTPKWRSTVERLKEKFRDFDKS